MSSVFKILLLSTALTLTGCTDNGQAFSSSPSENPKQAVADSAGYYKIGNPYQVAGVWYYPKEDYTYKEIGVASWYGPDFHNGITANGEMYNMHEMTAAHRTLPLPSVVRVTNLQNGRSVVLRVNDRGPFVNNRVIDVSMRAAQMLGFKDQGTAQVQVEILPEESKRLKEELLSSAGDKTVVSAPKTLNAGYYGGADKKAPVVSAPVAPSANASEDLLVGASANVKESKYNNWDEDMSRAQAQKTAFEVKAAPAVREQPKPAPKKVVENKIPAKPAEKKPEFIVPPGYYVQVGAFGSKENADKMLEKISRFGNAVIQPVISGGKTLYRVRLGPENAKKALEIMDNVLNNGISGARMVEEKGTLAAGQRLDNTF